MSETLTVSFPYDRALMRRAMTAWWQSVVPPNSFVSRAVSWSVAWFGVLLVALILGAYGISPSHVVAGLVGSAVPVLAFAYLQRTRMGRFWDIVGLHWEAAGVTTATFGPDGIDIADDVSRKHLDWTAVDAVCAARGGTVIRSGISMLAVPDDCLPEDLDPGAFRRRLGAWRDA